MKKIPDFKNEEEERKFWEENDSTDFIDWSKAERTIFTRLKPTTKSISLRLPEEMIARLKNEANKLDIPYQSLMKIILSEGLDRRKNLNV